MHLDAMSRENAETVRQWRNLDIDMYRTPFPLTKEMQEDFYVNTISSRVSPHRFWAVYSDMSFVGMVGLVNISLENRSAEISVVIDPERRGEGIGRQAVNMLISEGFNRLNLDNIYGECYECSKAIGFWRSTCKERGVVTHKLPRRKYVDGVYWNSIYFNFTRSHQEVV